MRALSGSEISNASKVENDCSSKRNSALAENGFSSNCISNPVENDCSSKEDRSNPELKTQNWRIGIKLSLFWIIQNCMFLQGNSCLILMFKANFQLWKLKLNPYGSDPIPQGSRALINMSINSYHYIKLAPVLQNSNVGFVAKSGSKSLIRPF